MGGWGWGGRVTSCRAEWDPVTLLVGREEAGSGSPSGLPNLGAVLGPPPPAPISSTFSSVREGRGKKVSLAGCGNPDLWYLGTSSSTLAGTNKVGKDGKFSELASNHAALRRKGWRGPESTSAGSLAVRWLAPGPWLQPTAWLKD